MSSLYKRRLKTGEVWYGNVKLRNGQYRNFCTHCTSKREAREMLAGIEAEIASGRDPFQSDNAPQNAISRLAEEFIKDRRPHWSAGTLDLYKDTMQVVCELFGDRGIETICKADITAYREHLVGRGALVGSRNGELHRKGEMAPNTLNRYLRSFSAFLTWCVEEGGIEHWHPPRVRQVPTPRKTIPEHFTSAEVEKLLIAMEEIRFNGYPVKPFMAFLVASGLRRDEAIALTWDMIDLQAGRMTLPPEITKTNRSAMLPITAMLRPILESLPLPRSGAVFLGMTENVSKLWKDICDAAGIPYRPLKSLRHTFITNLAAAGVDALFVGKLARHSKLQTTYQYYFTPDAEEARTAVEQSNSDFSTIILRAFGK